MNATATSTKELKNYFKQKEKLYNDIRKGLINIEKSLNKQRPSCKVELFDKSNQTITTDGFEIISAWI